MRGSQFGGPLSWVARDFPSLQRKCVFASETIPHSISPVVPRTDCLFDYLLVYSLFVCVPFCFSSPLCSPAFIQRSFFYFFYFC